MKNPLRILTLCLSVLIFSFAARADEASTSMCYGDYTPPVAICDAHTVVALGADGLATVYAYNFDDGSYDNCEISHFKAARMWQGWCPYGVADDTEFRPYVQFCCEDIAASPIWIIVRVFDHAGNYNDCMVQVTVQDGPGSLHCPPDKWIYCDYWFDWNDLYDPWNTFFGWATSGGGCADPSISVEIHDLRNSCGIGYIKRIFSTGGGGYGYGGNTCIQYINVKAHYPFNGYNIHWPPHYTMSGCDDQNIDPSHLPEPYNMPTWGDSQCSLIGYSYDDQVFEFVEGVCKKVLRTWTIIDWCTFDPHHPYYGGIWTYLQVIKLVDDSKPIFENCMDITVNGLEPECKGRLMHHPMVWDECTPADKLDYEYKIDIYANGSIDIIRHDHKYIDEILPIGDHKVYWYVDDNCGNLSSCSFRVKIIDKKPPTPICYAQLSTVVMPQGGMVTLWARDFNASSFDNCTHPQYLKYSFSSNILEASRVFTCDDVGIVPLQIYVTDQSGNQAYCNVSIVLTDNGPICPEMNPLDGSVDMFTGEAISGAEVALYKVMPNNVMQMDMMKLSGMDGSYRVGFGTTQYDRMLDVTKQSDPMAGVSTLDLVYLQQHILGSAQITHPAGLLAADVDGSGRAGVNDLLMLRDAIISGGRSLRGAAMPWEFYPEDCTWLPNGQPECEFSIQIDHTAPPTTAQNFIGYKVGDINGDVMHNPGNRAVYKYPIGVKYDEQHQAYLFVALEDADLLGIQLSLQTTLSGGPRPMAGGELNVSGQNCYLDNEKQLVNMSWVATNTEHVSKGDVLFTMDVPAFYAKRKGTWGKGIYRNEVYFTDRVAVPVELKRLDEQQETDGIPGAISGSTPETSAGLQARSAGTSTRIVEPVFAPNPMSEAGIVYFILDQAQPVNFEVYSANQQLMISRKIDGVRGTNEMLVSGSQLGLPGVYLYRLTIGGDTYTGRIVFVD